MELKKGNRADLNVTKFKIGLGWDPSHSDNEEFDLDVSAFILDQNGKVSFDGSSKGEKFIVFYNSEDRMLPSNLMQGIYKIEAYDPIKYPNKETDFRVKTRPVSPNFEVIGSLDDKDGRTSDGDDDEDMFIDLSKLQLGTKEIIIVVSIYESKERGNQTFGQVKNSYIRVVDYNSNKEILKYELDEDFSTEDAVAFGRIYRIDENWQFEALGNGINGGLEFFIKKYSSFIK
jgi:tellurium resistance protein TerD